MAIGIHGRYSRGGHTMEGKQCKPKLGDVVRIIWLPPCVNGSGGQNPYIGMEGRVNYLYDNGGFCIDAGGAVLCITQPKCKYMLVS